MGSGHIVQNASDDARMPSLDDVVHGIYEAALSADLWPLVLGNIAAFTRSIGAVIYAKTPAGWVLPLHSRDISPGVVAYQEEEWWKRNPWLEGRAAFGFRAGDVYADDDILTPQEMSGNPFYSDFLHRFGISRVMVAIIDSDMGLPTSLAVYRGPDQGLFTAQERADLLVIARHLEQSLRITSSYIRADAEHQTISQAFDAMEQPALVLDENFKPLKFNRSAERLVDRFRRRGDGGGRLSFNSNMNDFTNALQRARTKHPHGEETPEPVMISDQAGDERLVVWTSPLIGASADNLGILRQQKHVLVLAKPLEEEEVIDPTIIRSVFGLTTGEARLSSLLVAGRSIKDAARQLDIAEGTARTVLKRIFMKTDTHRQAELVMKIKVLKA